jgi:ubiquinol-cytochrome c reductase cytochrome c subunit
MSSPIRRLALPAAVLLLLAAALMLLPDISGRQVLAAPGDDQLVAQGATLFATSCASCHGQDGQGSEFGPPLIGVGAAAADFQLRTGRMPFSDKPGVQAKRKPPAFDDRQIRQLVAYVASLGDGPPIPQVAVNDGYVSRGQQLFVVNCAPCHGATANGGAVGGGAVAPALDVATPVQVAEAMLTGPGQMPVFDFDAADVNAVASYIDYLHGSSHPGGFSIGGIGPVPEGFVGWVLGMGLLFVIVVLVGRQWTEKGGDEEHVP